MKNRKWNVFLVLEGLTQYYFVFGLLNADYWWKASVSMLVFYFGVNAVEGIWGKEAPKKESKPTIE